MSGSAQIGHFIGGRHVAGQSGREADVFNPATGDVSARVALAGGDEVEAAVRAAREALPAWSNTPALRRARIMFKFKQLLDQHPRCSKTRAAKSCAGSR